LGGWIKNVNKLILFLLIVFIFIEMFIWKFQFKFNQNVLQFEQALVNDNLKNQVVYKGVVYQLYGLQGEGFVQTVFPVYSPVYISISSLEQMAQGRYEQ
jgi:hypothetical protein